MSELISYNNLYSFLSSTESGELVKMNYVASTTQTIQEVIGEVYQPKRANYVAVRTENEEYQVCNSNRKNRNRGDVIRDGRKVGEFHSAEQTKERITVKMWGYGYKQTSINKEEWEEMDREEKKDWCRSNWRNVKATEPNSFEVEELGEDVHW